MMTCFYQASSVWQTVLLVISQFAVISLATGTIVLFKRKSKLTKLIGIGAVFALNAVLYIVMQLDSRLSGGTQGLHLHIPYGVLLTVTMLSLGYCTLVVLGETKNRKSIGHSSIKEAFDNLPTGVCFFNEAGLPVLCNASMHRFGFAVFGKDVQVIGDLEACFADDFVPAAGVQKIRKVFVLPGGKAWHLEKRAFSYENETAYTQYIAADVTDLYETREKLMAENAQLRNVQEGLKKLSSNVVAVTREEEILNTKMRVHDEMGRCLMAAQQYLRKDCDETIPDSVAAAWQKAVSMLKYNNDTPDEDMLLQIKKTCEFVKLNFVQTGDLPKEDRVAYLLTCAVRECVTNAVRYAEATELYADFSETSTEAAVYPASTRGTGRRQDDGAVTAEF